VDPHDLNLSILDQLKAINNDAGAFAAGVLSNDISRDDQLDFAVRLFDLALAIRRRAETTAGLVVEGSDIDDRDSRKGLPAGKD
jgi:hypothetical protein